MQDAKQQADAARVRAANYLGSKVMQITDPFQMAITTYALQVANHKDRDTAFNRLQPMGAHSESKFSIVLFDFLVIKALSSFMFANMLASLLKDSQGNRLT